MHTSIGKVVTRLKDYLYYTRNKEIVKRMNPEEYLESLDEDKVVIPLSEYEELLDYKKTTIGEKEK